MRSSSGSERSPAASAVLSTLPPPAQIVLQESDDDDDDDDVPVIVSTQKAVPPVITEPPPGYQAPRVLESQVSDLDSDEFEVELILNHRSSGTKKKVSSRLVSVGNKDISLTVLCLANHGILCQVERLSGLGQHLGTGGQLSRSSDPRILEQAAIGLTT